MYYSVLQLETPCFPSAVDETDTSRAKALSFRQIGVVREEYAVSSDGMRMFGVMDLSSGFDGCRLHADFPIMPTPAQHVAHASVLTRSPPQAHRLHSA